MMLKNLFAVSTAAFFMAPLATAEQAPSFGDDKNPSVQQQDEDIADLLVIKVKLDSKGQEQQEGAVLIPLKVKVKLNANGLDTDALEQDADQAMVNAQEIPLDQSSFDASQVPADLKAEIDYADSLTETENLGWRVYTPFGAIGNRGYYGYGHYPYYGRSYHRGYYPRWGYYSGNRYNPYTYGHSRRYGGYGYHYYRR